MNCTNSYHSAALWQVGPSLRPTIICLVCVSLLNPTTALISVSGFMARWSVTENPPSSAWYVWICPKSKLHSDQSAALWHVGPSLRPITEAHHLLPGLCGFAETRNYTHVSQRIYGTLVHDRDPTSFAWSVWNS